MRKAVAVIDTTTDPQLREALARAMISMLGEPLLAVIREMMMNPLVIPESAGFKALKREIEAIGEARGEAIGEARGKVSGEAIGEARGKVHGEAQALLTVLRARGLAIDDATNERVQKCEDLEVLSRWISRAATATSLADVFGSDDAE